MMLMGHFAIASGAAFGLAAWSMGSGPTAAWLIAGGVVFGLVAIIAGVADIGESAVADMTANLRSIRREDQ